MISRGTRPILPASRHMLFISLQLLLSHIIASVLALGVYIWLTGQHLSSTTIDLVGMGTVGLLGLIFTLNLQYGFYRSGQLVTGSERQGLWTQRLDKSICVWPLHNYLKQLRLLRQRAEARAHEEKLNREQMLEQARNAASQEERNRIARDLHDSIKQQIFSISVSAAAAKAHMHADMGSASEALEDIQRSTREAQIEMRALLQQLRSSPLEQTNLREALQTQGEALGYRTGAHVTCEIGNLPSADLLPPQTEEQLFRIVQESFANIARHARATHVWLTLQQEEEQLRLSIRDDGQGFDQEQVKQGMGLANIHERARNLCATVHIQSTPGKGTYLQIHIPLLLSHKQTDEEARFEVELERRVEKAQNGYQWSGTAALIAFMLLNVNVPQVCALLALLVSAFALIQGIYSRLSLREFGPRAQTEFDKLWQHEGSLYLRLFGLVVGCLITINIQSRLWDQADHIWILLIEGLLALSAILPLIWLRNRANERYFRQVAEPMLTWELTYSTERSRRKIRLWLVVTAIAFISSRFLFTFPPHALEGWIGYLCLGAIAYWGLTLAIERFQLKRWQAQTGKAA
ncbi:sensor histidine kinase [Ktedonospora formicarum]|uniref:Histidine kinase domain-containing protein n=1 Tax=Ktedonospora formicarum TaxID=2778364 RepID=A0A8J3I065_9CHLR|nr:sensor histidine kinase [Ktedonospora formicarum]GHO44228.1 hypothetical protein KSX_23910 [Ktedonospora formicarum]